MIGTGMARYALYFAPAIDSPWWQAGCRWLGRDPDSGALCLQPEIPGVPPLMMEKLTAEARRYGFHATLKAPFRLAEGFSETNLITMAESFAAVQPPLMLQDVRVRPLAGFLALRPADPLAEIASLAMRCVAYFDNLRAPPAPSELAKRRSAGLTTRQELLLQRWGYPYTEEEFRFHMTLTDSLDDVDQEASYALRKAAEAWFEPAARAAPLTIDALTIFREEQPGAPFSILRRLPFEGRKDMPALPAAGRLFFIVGPSGAGKDTLLRWVERHLPDDANLVFSRRTITRPAHSSESHEATDMETFWRCASTGHFSMVWQANDLCYGIPRGIEADLRAGRDVIVNGSREYVPQLRQLFPQAYVIWIEADAAQLRQRIESRQREAGAALLKRLDRAVEFTPPEARDIIRIDNSGPVEIAGQRLLEIIASRPSQSN